MNDDDPLGSYGLARICLEHRPVFESFFSTCRTQLSDYTFANTFIWRDSVNLRWRLLHDCLCVFANGDGGLTLLFPPMGDGNAPAAAREALAICDDYCASCAYPGIPRIEYASAEMIERLGGAFVAEPMSGDYVYETRRMIDLAGGELASKRHDRNRFARRYEARVEDLDPQHAAACLELLHTWQGQSEHGAAGDGVARIKRSKEIAATRDALEHLAPLGLRGMVLWAGDNLAGFTLGESLDGGRSCSILVEKTDRQYAGSAQYIFSEFCRLYWPHTQWCNAGDDWEIPSLAWTKQSYRPAYRLDKWWLHRPVAVRGGEAG